MAIIDMDYAMGNGVVSSIEADTQNLLGSITTQGGSFSTSEPCIMIGVLTLTAIAQPPRVYVNGEEVWNLYSEGSLNQNQSRIGGTSYNHGFYIPPNSTVTTDSVGAYDLKFYKLI